MQTDRSIPELTKDMAFHLGDMFRNELKLATAEATDGVKSLGGAVGQVATGAVVGTAALTVGLMALAFGLTEFMPMWASAAIVAAVAGIVAGTMVKAGQKAMANKDLSLPRTREQVSRDIENITEHVH